MDKDTNASCVETPAAPEWLSKLEDRRERLKFAKLGHEVGAGAPCSVCNDKCPGLDLHFWRKVCRNCKCRKDQHMCQDDDTSGWAQFEILGQIRSKPAFIKIKTLSQPVKVDWVPPNAAPDVVADYLDKLGSKNVPVAGSEAAAKRKQQLEFQVPPHDLDAGFCDNLTEAESNQLMQYVQKIRDHCVGQGNVVRVGNYAHATVAEIQKPRLADDMELFEDEKYLKAMSAIKEQPVSDPILCTLLSNDKLSKAIIEPGPPCAYGKIFVAFSEPLSDGPPISKECIKLSPVTKQKLNGLNEAAVQSLVLNGPIYDKIFAVLNKQNLDISRDPRLGPLVDLRKEYVSNPVIKKDLDSMVYMPNAISYSSPLKTPSKFINDLAFNSPLPSKTFSLNKMKYGAQMQQDTPMRKVLFGNVTTSNTVPDFLPTNVDYERDPVFAHIINSDSLNNAIQKAKQKTHPILALSLGLRSDKPDIFDTDLTDVTKRKLQSIGVTNKDMLQSAVLNAPFYERLFRNLDDLNINYSNCQQLKPLEQLSKELRSDRPLYEEVREYVTALPGSLDIAYAPININLGQAMSISRSTDSGFESPSHSAAGVCNPYVDDIKALPGKLVSVPGIQDMNMYPSVAPSTDALQKNLHNLSLKGNNDKHGHADLPTKVAVNCPDCKMAIHFGEVAVKAERAGKEFAWHPDCFRCYECRELLADLVYFFHQGHVYCGRDLALKLKIPRCKACDELIFTKEYTAAEGSTFHIKHFCCYHCDDPLAGHQYVPDEKTNMPLCLKCYDEHFGKPCQRCLQIIGPTEKGVSWNDIHWHDSCFLCAGANCDKSLIGGRFCVKQNMPFCSPACVHSMIK
ncbi:testin LIM domain protein [Haematobia irritans]|uniref:testin LIM domain protein n=1 Tax=Haematobia irritans TaxID=7368 RepID=UPI003F505F9C